jgi:phosphotransferase system  glucose/maltose/N-acetylglucosamine-specific IIC component
MKNNLVIALLCGLVNMFLAVTMPCLLKKVDTPYLTSVKTVFNNNKHLIIVSSIVVTITAYLALMLYPLVSDDMQRSCEKMCEKMPKDVMLQLLGKNH